MDLIHFFDELGLSPNDYEITDTAVRMKQPGADEVYSHQQIRALKTLCDRLKGFRGFETVKSHFRNPTQFGATVFELNCADFCLSNYEVVDLDFDVAVEVNGRTKHPEFEFHTAGGLSVLVECKSLESLNRVRASRAVRLLSEVDHALPTIPQAYRFEVQFASLPSHWNRNLKDQIASSAEFLLDRSYTARHLVVRFPRGRTVQLKLCQRDDPFFFHGSVRAAAGDRNRPRLLVSEADCYQKDIKRVLMRAVTQLPEDRPHMIFLYPIREVDCRAVVDRFFERQRRSNLLAVHCRTDRFVSYRNPHCVLAEDTVV